MAIDNAQLHTELREMAVRLQRAVLPAALPRVAGWEVAAHYSPAGHLDAGGDFYDVIPLDDGRIAMFVGDVMGRGVHAAAAMAQMRAAVRAFVAVDPAPRVGARRGWTGSSSGTTIDQLVTMVYAVADPARDELVVANAGHPPPLLLRADGSAELLAVAEGCSRRRVPGAHQVTLPFRAGDAVLAFTDGLIERRNEDITQGQERLLKAVMCMKGADLTEALASTVEDVRDPSRDDDVAAVAARRR